MHEDLLVTSSWDSSIKVWRMHAEGTRGRGDLVMELNEHEGEVCFRIAVLTLNK